MDYISNDDHAQILIEQPSKCMTDNIVDRLVAYRKHFNMTQQDIANITGIKRANIARIESKRSAVSLDSLVKYAKSLHMNLELRLEPIEEREKRSR